MTRITIAKAAGYLAGAFIGAAFVLAGWSLILWESPLAWDRDTVAVALFCAGVQSHICALTGWEWVAAVHSTHAFSLNRDPQRAADARALRAGERGRDLDLLRRPTDVAWNGQPQRLPPKPPADRD